MDDESLGSLIATAGYDHDRPGGIAVILRTEAGTAQSHTGHARARHRTGLAPVDDLDHMVAVARRVHPDRPGEIDYCAAC